jgi:UDP-N-acetylglucosamine 2-epimerase (non-hydrolysing)
VLTGSGGVQEEAPSLGKPVLVMREVMERMEGVEAGAAAMVGSNPDRIVEYASRLLDDADFYKNMAKARQPLRRRGTARRLGFTCEGSSLNEH